MPFNLALEKASPTTISVALEPARNVLASMVLLTREEELPGISNWIHEIRRKFTPEELFQHTLVVIGFYHAVMPEDEYLSFPDYLARLAMTDPANLRQKMFDAYAAIGADLGKSADVDWDAVLVSSASYVNFLRERFGDKSVIEAVETRAYDYVMDPPAMKALIVDHLQAMWDKFFQAEWRHTEPMLREAVKAFQAADFGKMDRFEAVRFVTGQDLDEEKWKPTLERASRIIFIPNAHIGPYVSHLPDKQALIVLFGARQPENATVRVPELDRADIVSRLSALADDTRLQILQMIRDNGEMRAQEIIEATGLSQPSVSRYLGQLAATGYLQERRVNGAKSYTLNRDRIAKTCKAISVFLLGQ
ncbi:MAG: winged helix-turn-helix domain-containing protein [Chloroflexota bacterium]